MTRFLMPCLLALLFSPQESAAQSRVTVSPEGMAAGAAASVYLDAGGSYEPSAKGAATIIYEAPSTDYPVAPPSMEWHFEAAAWGSNGREAAAFAHADVFFAAAQGATYLNPPPQSGTMSYAGYRASCDPNVNNHCDCSIPTNCTFQTGASASIRRLYRIKNTTTNSLPPAQTVVPLLVDYAHHRRFNTLLPLPSPQEIFSVSSGVSVLYRDGATIVLKREAFCARDSCASGATLTGTLELPVHVDYLEVVEMSVSINIFVNNRPTCTMTMIGDVDLCVVLPYQGSVQALVDPFAYVDPSWEYASWFAVEVSDDDGATWDPVERTTFDLVAFGIEDGGSNPGPDGGTPDAGQPDAGVPDAGGPDSGDPGPGANPNGGSSGGCAAYPTAQHPAQPSWVFGVLLSLVAITARRVRGS